MKTLRCEKCNGELERTGVGEIYKCKFCGSIMDNEFHIENYYTSMGPKEKKRLLDAANVHIKNRNFGSAEIMLKQLEHECPDDPDVLKLRFSYDACYDLVKTLKKKDDVEKEINKMENDVGIWQTSNNVMMIGTIVNIVNTLNKANAYGIKCPTFRQKIKDLTKKIEKGTVTVNGEPNQDSHNFVQMLSNMSHINELSNMREQKKLEMDSLKSSISKKTTAIRVVCTIVFFALIFYATKVYFNSEDYTTRRTTGIFCIFGMILSVIMFIITILYSNIFSSDTILKKWLLKHNKNQSNIHQQEEQYKDLQSQIDDLENKVNITKEEYFSALSVDNIIKREQEIAEMLKNYS